jgi:hypothetical protein
VILSPGGIGYDARMSLRALLIAFTASGLLLAASPAAAESSAEDKAAAQALFDQGSALMAKGDFQAACPKLEASLQRFDGIGTRGKLAQCYEKVGRVASAWAMYREVDALASKSGDTRRATVAREAAKSLEARVPHLTVTVPDASRVDQMTVKRDGAVLDSGAWGAPIAVDPGQHHLEVSAPGYETWTKDVDVAESQSESVEVPALTALPPEATPPTTGTSTEGAVTAEVKPESTPYKPIAMVAMGVGVVSLGVGGYFGLRASSKWNGAFDDGHCNSSTNKCDSTGQEQTDQARSAATLSNVFIGAGVVLAAGGAALWFLAPKEKGPEKTGLAVVPIAGRDRGGVWLSGAF